MGILAMMTDERLIIEQFCKGSHQAFQELFMRYHLKVYYFVLGLIKSESDAEDLTQEIFIKLWTNRGRFAEVRTFSAYLYVLAKHTTFSYIEARQIRQEGFSKQSLEEEPQDKTPYEELVAKDLQLLMDMVVDSMPVQRKTVFRLSREAGLSNTEIAEKLHLSKKTVENHLNLALKELKNVLLVFLILTLC